ncbi:hypothetical protein [Longimicrobium sp.]|uniref:hypothetical protein n=1 Tax=Longimicrobium sp. TaxID=2029185 RepID=UPI002BFFF9B3|nr:hypothetical protein [Longimicrobium sp.]HSU14292.1 hypothetical protein [Longimicrobium sp.]
MRDEVIAMLQRLPANVTIEEIEYHVSVMAGFERGVRDVEAGRVFTQEEVEEHILKNQVMDMLRRLPDYASLEDIGDHVSFMADLQEGVRAADEGDVISHEEMKARLREEGYL